MQKVLIFITGTWLTCVSAVQADLLKGFKALQEKRFAVAINEFKPLAEGGDVIAQTNLGIIFEKGLGVSKSYKMAIKWFKLAAEQKNGFAQAALGSMYEEGQGVKKDYVKAYMWMDIAASANEVNGKLMRGLIVKKMSAEQIKRGQVLVQKCIAKSFKDC